MTDAAARPRRPASLKAKLLLLCGSIVFAGAVAEVGFRLLGIPRDELAFLPKDGSVDWDCYSSNYRNYFVERKLAGGRTAYCVDHTDEPPRIRDLEAAKKAGAYTVLAIGDSFTYGLGVKVVDNWPSRLEKLLPESVGKPVVVSNVALVGRHVMEILEGQYKPHALGVGHTPPDLVVYGWCLNDPWWQPAAGETRSNPLAPTKMAAKMDNADVDDFINLRTANLEALRVESLGGWARKRLRIVDVPLRAWENYRIHQRTMQFYLDLYDPKKNADGLAVTWSAVKQMHDAQTAAGKRFLVAIFPMFVDLERNYPLQPIHDALAKQFTAMGVEFVDLLPAYRGKSSASLWVHPVDRHPNDVAQDLAAREIVRRLQTKK